VIMGTPDYMSPEQARGRIEEIDHRTDQWALAAMTYEMLSRRTPFAGEDVASVLYQVTREEPRSLSKLVRGLPLEIERVVHRALSKRPGDRFASVIAFARALEEAAGPVEGRDEPPDNHSRPVSASRKATVAYGAEDHPMDAPATLRGAPTDEDDATVISGPPSVTVREGKRTTFSHATGEARIGFRWSQLRDKRRPMLAGAGLALGVAIWVAVHSGSQPHSGKPALAMRVSGSALPVSARTVISPMKADPPPFVGPPLPPLEELAKAQAAAAARAQRVKEDPLGRLANPFLDPFEVEEPYRSSRHKPVESAQPAPAPPAPATAPDSRPPRPQRQLIREL
jgi:hypothetical protein